MINEILHFFHTFHGVVLSDIGTAVGVGGSLLGGLMGQSAADTQASAANSATALQKEMYAQQRSDQLPWLSMGTGAINELGYLMGINPMAPQTLPAFSVNGTDNRAQQDYQRQVDQITRENQHRAQQGLPPLPMPTAPQQQGPAQFTPSTALGGFGSLAHPFGLADFQADPGYAFRLSEGQKALERSQAAKGGLLSGAALKAMDSYSQGMASQEFQNAYDRYNTNNTNLYNRLAGIAGTGQTAANNIGSAGQNAANNMGNNMMSAGAARSAGQVNMGNMLQTGLGFLGNSLSGGSGMGQIGPYGSGGWNWSPVYNAP
jgi:hypothetical protein